MLWHNLHGVVIFNNSLVINERFVSCFGVEVKIWQQWKVYLAVEWAKLVAKVEQRSISNEVARLRLAMEFEDSRY